MDEKVKKRIDKYMAMYPKSLSHDNPTKNPNTAKVLEQFFKTDDMICLPKDGVIKIEESVGGRDDVVLPSRVLEHFIRKASHRVVMNFCICRESNECRDYPRELGCIFLGEAASRVHPDLGRQASVEEALDHAARCREAGLVHCVGNSKLDNVWLEVWPERRLMSICNCCPCCCITRTIPYSAPFVGAKFSRMPGVSVHVTDDCGGCGLCADECIFQAITMEDGRPVINDECRGCGRCAEACPDGAIEIRVDDSAYVDKTIERIGKILDVT